ncbi:hypothetical protein VTL71DRAFT_7512 [Oculimacula yallundae]|uniref:Rhodopsin domain-containing protein n=1 Tax=Oculimacula yallundae TaxID=86028 RepID=A0ABR4BUD5_9HELO
MGVLQRVGDFVLLPFLALYEYIMSKVSAVKAGIHRARRDPQSRERSLARCIITIACAVLAAAFIVCMFAIPIRADGTSLLGGLGSMMKLKRDYISPNQHELMWNTVGFGIPVVLSFIARMVTRGWVLRRMHIDDPLMVFTMLMWICLIILSNFAGQFATNLYPKEYEERILANPANAYYRTFGSQLGVGVEQAMLAAIWGSKLCVWFFLQRLHRKLPRFEAAIWFLFIYIWAGLFIVEIIFFFASCLPFSQYWAVPVKDPECASHHRFQMVQLIFNISSDLALILFPLPMIWVAQLPWKRKLILTAIFGLAVFKIVAAVMNQ